MPAPPFSLVVSPGNWHPHDSGLSSGLFVDPHSGKPDEILIHIRHVRLSWTDKSGRSCAMELEWDGQSMSMSGTDVTIYDVSDPSDPQPIATELDVTISQSDPETWKGGLSQSIGAESNPGVFIAQAGTGGPPPDPDGEPEDESVLRAVTSAAG